MAEAAKDLLRALDRALDASPDWADGAVLKSFQPKAAALADAIEREIAEGARAADLSSAQADLTMLRDVADQSPKHVASLQARIKSYLSGEKPEAGRRAEKAEAATVKPADKPFPALVAVIAVAAIVLLSK